MTCEISSHQGFAVYCKGEIGKEFGELRGSFCLSGGLGIVSASCFE